MHLHVSRNAGFAETLPADGAQVAGARVQPFVLLQGVAAQEALVALAAGEYPASFVEPLVLIITRRAGESLLTLAAAVRKAVEPHVSLQLIRMFKNLFTRGAFGFVLHKVFAHRSHAQKPFVFPCGLFPSPSLLVLQVVLLAFFLFVGCIFLFLLPLYLQVAFNFLLFSVFRFLPSLCSGFFGFVCYMVLNVDVLLYFLL